jgi:2-(1,2-epoxy-1,2-dihydrophenyl)acetyl-CoA isomerase
MNFTDCSPPSGAFMSQALVLSSQSGAVLTLTLNRPAALNSFTGDMHVELLAALNQTAADVSVRCVVITGAGRAFCAGQDLSDPAVAPKSAADPTNLRHVIDLHYTPLLARLRSLPVPLIAAVNGVAAGAGANFALACDMVLAADNASFIQAFSKIGLIPDTGGTWLLPRLVGGARAMGLAMTGDKLSAADAERIGLIWKCVPAESLTTEVKALADKLAAMPTAALVATRKALHAAAALSFEEALAAEAGLQSALGFAHDYQEGVAAFQAKRAAVFTDR